ncbi:MAG: FkbM family methyltransferase [Terracidiphilus sp.]
MREAIRNLLARPAAQPLLLRLLKLCHAGLNYGGGQSVSSSGELEALRFVAKGRAASLPFILFDIGASEGDYLSCALDLLGRELTAYAFEPQTAAFQLLHRRFGNHARVHLVQAAVGSVPGSLDLYFGSDGETTASFNRNTLSRQNRSEAVQVTTIDKLCEDSAIERIDPLKIDTEGYEMDVLRGASRMIESGRIAAIQFEFGETFLRTPYHFVDLWELLSPRYTLHRILRRGLAPIRQYTPDLEIYKIANFLCLRKA